MTDLMRVSTADEFAARQHRLPLVALGEKMNLEVGEITGAPHSVGDRFDRPLDEAGVVGVRRQIDVAAAHGEGELPMAHVRRRSSPGAAAAARQ